MPTRRQTKKELKKEAPKKPKPAKPNYPRYSGYAGRVKWLVRHKSFGEVTVFAPSESASIVTAATVWKTDWTRIDFYCNAHSVRA